MAQIGEPVLTQPEPIASIDGIVIIGRTPWQIFWRRFKKDRWAIGGAVVVIQIALLAIFAPLTASITGHAPSKVLTYVACDRGEALPPGSNGLIFGGSSECGDFFVQIAYGARTSLAIAVAATILEMGVGIVFGLIAGFYRGRWDTAISRTGDVFLAFPVLLLALGIAQGCGQNKEGCLGGFLKPGMLLVAFVIGFFGWPYLMRIIRGQVLSIREKEFVEAARAIGASNSRIMFREILPNLLPVLVVYATVFMPINILFEAALSYLNIGLPPDVPSWGKSIESVGLSFIHRPWLLIVPGVFLVSLTLGFNLLGDGLRDALDVRSDE